MSVYYLFTHNKRYEHKELRRDPVFFVHGPSWQVPARFAGSHKNQWYAALLALLLAALAACNPSSGESSGDALTSPSQSVGRRPDASGQLPVTADAGGAGGRSGTVIDAGDVAPSGSSQPAGWDSDIALPLAEDLDPRPDVLEVEIEAREAEVEILPGIATRVWTYNGMLPGPLLRAKRGDRLIVHFTNRLPEPTTIHWHGVRVPSSMDGTAAMQDPIQPGESFTYDYVIPDAGTYWYHPHINSAAQVGYGLYGPLIVDEPDDPVLADDLVLVFSDISLDAAGQLEPADVNGWFGDYFGREGSVQLVNGKVQPRLRGHAGVPQRWRIINAARTQYFQLAVPEAQLVRVGGDGGLIEQPQPIERLMLTPSERGEVLVVPPASADGEIDVLLEDADRFEIKVPAPPEPMLHFEVMENPRGAPTSELPAQLRELPEFELAGATTRRIELGETPVDGVGHLSINGQVFGVETDAGADSGSAHSHDHGPEHLALVGDTEIWEVVNTTDFQHPFHLHGFFFEVLESAGTPWPVREWKDTVNVPSQSSVRFAIRFDDRPGMWMFHCHILDHAHLGMMAVLSVERP